MKTFILFSIVVALFIPTVKSCEDVPNYTFTLYWDNLTRVECDWLTKNKHDSEDRERKANYCPRVKQFCPFSCDNCTNAPTFGVPSKGPTIAPSSATTTSPTKATTKAPTKLPSKCGIILPNFPFSINEMKF